MMCLRRYIDDAFAIVRACDACVLFRELHDWHDSIKLNFSARGSTVLFLDSEITLSDSFLSFQTYRKAQNAYLYIPRISCHPNGVFKALIPGETQRIFRTCRGNPQAFQSHLSFSWTSCRNEDTTESMQKSLQVRCFRNWVDIVVQLDQVTESSSLNRLSLRLRTNGASVLHWGDIGIYIYIYISLSIYLSIYINI